MAPAAHPQHLFAEAAAIADHDPTLRSSPTTGVAAAVSFPASRLTTFRLEVTFRMPFAELRWREPCGRPHRDVRQRHRAPSTSMMVGVEIPSRRWLQMAILVGGTVTNRMSQAFGFTEYRDSSGAVMRCGEVDGRSTGYHWFAVSGEADAAFSVTRRLAIVPPLRVHSYLASDHTSLLFLRPRVAVRWYF